jgi:hypothetical protein
MQTGKIRAAIGNQWQSASNPLVTQRSSYRWWPHSRKHVGAGAELQQRLRGWPKELRRTDMHGARGPPALLEASRKCA